MILAVPYRRQAGSDTCVPACLLMCLAYFKPAASFTEQELAERCGYIPDLGCTLSDMFETAEDLDLGPQWLNRSGIESAIASALENGVPIVGFVPLRCLAYLKIASLHLHSVVVVGLEPMVVVVHDPDPKGGPALHAARAIFFAGEDSYYLSFQKKSAESPGL
jgi:hypothetical protein